MNIIPEFKNLKRHYMTHDGLMKATVYADQGPAIYNNPDGTQWAQLSSPTAFTNLLEATLLRRQGEVIDGLSDLLPRAELIKTSSDYPDETLTSIDISHRLASAWLLKTSKMVVDGKADKKPGEFTKVLMEDIRTKGVVPALVYYCPNTVLHGYMLTMLDKINPNHNKGTGLTGGSIRASNITRVMNAGVSFDVVAPTAKGLKIDGIEGKKLSSMALGHIPISSSNYITSDNVEMHVRINYKGIDSLPVPSEVREMLCDLANFQVTSLLSDEIDLRRDTILINQDNLSYDTDDCLQSLRSSLSKCLELGYINPNIVSNFTTTVS